MAASMEAPEITPLVTNKELIETFFELDHISNQHACRYEDCKKRNKKVSANTNKHGYANLMSHLRNKHSSYMDDYAYRTQPGRRNAQLHFVTLTKSEAENLFEWFVLVLDKNMPLNFLDDSDWRKVIKLEPITSKRFKSVGSRLVHVVEGVIGADLAKRRSVGLVFDGWGKRVDGTAYFAITGASDFGFDKDGNRLSFPLLAFAPFLDEEKHTADEQLTFIEVNSQIYCSTIILLILHVMIISI